jgi:ketosteroid isomerase-like protein
MLGILLFTAGCVRADEPSDTEKAIRAVRDELYGAAVKQDAATIKRLLSADYVCLQVDGSKQKRDDRIKVWTSKDSKLQSISFPESDIRVYGDVAIETGQSNNLIDDAGTGYRGICAHTIIYRKAKDGWTICGEHLSLKAKK